MLRASLGAYVALVDHLAVCRVRLSGPLLHRNPTAVLDWSEGELISAFETLPSVEDEETLYTFAASSDGATVELAVWPSHNEIALSIRVGEAEHPVYSSGFVRCDELRRRRGAEGSETVGVRRGGEVVLEIKVQPRLAVAGAGVAV